MTPHKIAVVAGDCIGQEVMPEGRRVLRRAAQRFHINLKFEHLDWGCHQYQKIGSWMPANWKERLAQCNVICFGACGWPATVPDHVSLWGSLLKFRREFNQYTQKPVKRFLALLFAAN